MRIPGEYAKTMRTLFNKLRREYGKPKEEELTDPVEQLVLGILATNANTRRAKSILKRLHREMADFNELRVTPAAELGEFLEKYVKDPHERAQWVINGLSWVFGKFDTMDLAPLREKQHAELRSIFETIPGCPDHSRATMLLFSFGIPVFPLDDEMLDYLIKGQALPEDVSLSEAEHYMERHFRAAEVKELYLHVKRACEQGTTSVYKRTVKPRQSRPAKRKK